MAAAARRRIMPGLQGSLRKLRFLCTAVRPLFSFRTYRHLCFFLINVSHLSFLIYVILFPCYFPDYDTNKTVKCSSEYVYDESRQRSLQHFIEFEPLADKDLSVVLPSGAYAACGFQIRLVRKTMQYLVQVYLPSCMFVVVSWVSFLIKPEVVPGRMALLVTLFLVLINIFNSVR